MTYPEHMIMYKIKNGCFYHIAKETEIKLCNSCPFKNAWGNKCRRFNASIEREYQRNGGFHHIPCTQCLNHKLDTKDIEILKKYIKNKDLL